jgi:hypothetical protein
MKLTTVCPNKIEFEIDDMDVAIVPAKIKYDPINHCLFFLVRDKEKKQSKKVLLKRYLLAALDDQLVQPIDKNELNLKRDNLKIVSKSQVASETTRAVGVTGIRGISFQKDQNCFKGKIIINRISYGKSFSINKLGGYDEALKIAKEWVEDIKKKNS